MNPRFRLEKLKQEVATVCKEVEFLRTDDRLVRSLVADDEKSDEDLVRIGAIEKEDRKSAEFTHQGVISRDQPLKLIT